VSEVRDKTVEQAEVMKLYLAMIDKVMEWDPVMERSLKFKRAIDAISCP
jgi:hypothetical protein